VTLGVLALAALAYALQQTMILPALPDLQRDLPRLDGLGDLAADRVPCSSRRSHARARQAR